eukprot:scaffold116462_cov54-Phaeocystis_antarctica.AAC.1
MAVMKVGPLLDLPKAARIQLMRAERSKAKAQQVDAERAKGQREADAAALQKLQRAEELAYEAALPLCVQWAAGQGEPKLVKRYARRKELQLLPMETEALKLQVPGYEWRQFMTSGLQRAEVQALAYKLRQPGVPSQAAPFIEVLRQRIYSYGASYLTADLAGGEQRSEANWLAQRSEGGLFRSDGSRHSVHSDGGRRSMLEQSEPPAPPAISGAPPPPLA